MVESLARVDTTALAIASEPSAEIKRAVSHCVADLSTNYPAIVRKYTDKEVLDLKKLWAQAFCDIPPELIRAACMRFMVDDRRGFFPSVGEIIGKMEEIVRAQEFERNDRYFAALGFRRDEVDGVPVWGFSPHPPQKGLTGHFWGWFLSAEEHQNEDVYG